MSPLLSPGIPPPPRLPPRAVHRIVLELYALLGVALQRRGPRRGYSVARNTAIHDEGRAAAYADTSGFAVNSAQNQVSTRLRPDGGVPRLCTQKGAEERKLERGFVHSHQTK